MEIPNVDPGAIVNDVLGGGAGARASFEFRSGPFVSGELVALRLRGREEINRCYAFDVDLASSVDPAILQPALLGAAATLVMNAANAPSRTVAGVIAAVRPAGNIAVDTLGARHKLRVRVVPKLWLLKKRKTSRIFQDRTIPEIVKAVFDEGKIAQKWKTTREYVAKKYCVQYQETDYDFARRLLSEEGIFFFFAHPSGGADALTSGVAGAVSGVAGSLGIDSPSDALGTTETVLLCDDASQYPAIAAGALIEDALSAIAPVVSRAAKSLSSTLSRAIGSLSQAVGLDSPHLPFRDAEGMSSDDEHIANFTARRALHTNELLLRDFDFVRPLLPVTAQSVQAPTMPFGNAVASAIGGGIGGAAGNAIGEAMGGAIGEAIASVAGDSVIGGLAAALGAVKSANAHGLRFYDHHGEYDTPDFDKTRAQLFLEQYAADRHRASGTSPCRRLLPGHRFLLAEHPLEQLNREWVVVRIEHHGERPAQGTDTAAHASVYRNEFTAVPAVTPYRPPRPKRRAQQILETAIVVGPAGEEIYTDALGRIKVQFHWDLQGRRDEHSSCWIRVSHAWGGANWGTQFIPRIGMEVLVSFIGGDEDRPIVLGCVYNGIHPPPFKLPQDKTRSGFRTQSSLGGVGYNELSFEDAHEQEQIYLRAQRNYDEVVLRDHTARVDRDETLHVKRDRTSTIDRDQIDRVKRNHTETIDHDRTTEVKGNRRETVHGNQDTRVVADLTTHVEGNEKRFVERELSLSSSDDVTLRVQGCLTTVVGKHDQKRSALLHVEGTTELSSTKRLEVRADEGVVIRCGKSSIRMGPKSIEIASPTLIFRADDVLTVADKKVKTKAKTSIVLSSDKVALKGSAAALALSDSAKLASASLAVNAAPDDVDDQIDDAKPIEPTKLVLQDQEGGAVPHQPFVLVMNDGTERSGVFDEGGKAELELEDSGTIVFPALQKADPGAMKAYAIRQGDYFTRLAAEHGFDADKTWNDPKNKEIRDKRKTMNVLAPGDIVFIPDPRPKKIAFNAKSSNTFNVEVPKVKIDIVLHDGTRVLSGEKYVVEGLQKKVEGTSGGDGKVSFDAPTHVRSVRLILPDKKLVYPVLLGELDPIDERTGVRQRLEHLGFFGHYGEEAGSHDQPDGRGELQDREARDAQALKAFQQKHGLEATGQPDAATKDALVSAHGS